MRFVDLSGRRFGALVVVARAGHCEFPTGRRLMWSAKCDCGNTVRVTGSNVRTMQSCGCLRAKPRTHGMTGSPTYRSWAAMLSRCTNPAFPKYAEYGAQGITVCSRWRSFENFLADMGERPTGKTLDRKDNAKGYEPGNCRWATHAEQSANRKVTRRITYGGKTLTLIEWEQETGITRSAIRQRLFRLGWSVAETLTTPNRGY